jgi:hypothetical protein
LFVNKNEKHVLFPMDDITGTSPDELFVCTKSEFDKDFLFFEVFGSIGEFNFIFIPLYEENNEEFFLTLSDF